MKPRHLQNLLLTLCMALSCVSGAAAVIHVSGYEGRDIQVSCSYEHGYESYEKYLCRNDCGSDDVLVTTTQGKNSKYSITDDHNKQVYTTTISVLTSGDAGKYWCGVTRTGKDYYPAEVQLKVVPDSCCDLSTTIHGHEGGSVSISCLYNSVDQNNLKYFCRGQKPSTCLEQAVVTSDEKHQGRYTLTNGSLQFTMTIDRLTLQDPGWYLCGVQRNTGLDVFSAVQLEVKEWCCEEQVTMSGIVGRPLTMQCPYPPEHQKNSKFLCKGDTRDSCTQVVNSERSAGTENRFILENASSSSFSVRITELKAGDAGTYWCGSDAQWSPGNYRKIVLSEVFPTTSTTTPTIPSITVENVRSQSTQITEKPINGISLPHPVVFIGPAVLLLILIPTLIVLWKYKCHKVQGAAVIVSQSTIKGADVLSEENMYGNQEMVTCSKLGISKQQEDYDDAGDQQDCVYENFNTTDDIYCNEFYSKGNQR